MKEFDDLMDSVIKLPQDNDFECKRMHLREKLGLDDDFSQENVIESIDLNKFDDPPPVVRNREPGSDDNDDDLDATEEG